MLTAPRWASLVAASLLIGGGAIAACNDVTIAPLEGQPPSDAQAPCPVTVGGAPGAACTDEGAVCSYAFPCPAFASSVTCTCHAGRYACSMPGGGAVDAAACPLLKTTESCPASETSANGLFCSEPGLICTYPSACPSSIPAYDTCQCVGGRTDAEIPHFQCSPACELPGDAMVPATPADAGSDAPMGADVGGDVAADAMPDAASADF